MKICLINYADDKLWFPLGAKRLRKSFDENGFDGDYVFYTHEQQLDCPTHQETPYAFKAYALLEALNDGYDIAIWADASIQLEKPFDRVLSHIEEHKYLLLLNGWTTGIWCSDAALPLLGITREESFDYPHLMACVMGFDLRNETCVKFVNEYYEKANNGSFRGAWSNNNNEVSTDPRVLGHRHDQTAASIIAWNLGMRHFAKNLLYYQRYPGGNPDSILFRNKGGH